MTISSRRDFLKTGFGAPLLAAGRRARQSQPNIVFVLTDDQRYDAMSIAGHPFFRSPNMDRIGLEGAHLRNCFVTTPLCSPLAARRGRTRTVSGCGVPRPEVAPGSKPSTCRA